MLLHNMDPDGNVATAHHTTNTADGYYWTFEISDSEVIELPVDGYDDPDTTACVENGYAAAEMYSFRKLQKNHALFIDSCMKTWYNNL